jgi:hypothetical protein
LACIEAEAALMALYAMTIAANIAKMMRRRAIRLPPHSYPARIVGGCWSATDARLQVHSYDMLYSTMAAVIHGHAARDSRRDKQRDKAVDS